LPAASIPHPGRLSEGSSIASAPDRPEGRVLPLSVFGLECSLETASLDALEDVARTVTNDRIVDCFSRFRETEEVALLSTCHRVELMLLFRSPREVNQWRAVLPGPPESWKCHESEEAVRHLFRVAAGRESLAVGELEVSHQVRAAGRRTESRHPRPVLRELFRAAADAAEEVCPTSPSTPSIAATASNRLLELVNRPSPRVLVVGSGTVGRQVSECLSSFAELTVVYHQKAPEDSFLQRVGAQAIRFEQFPSELPRAHAIVTAAKFGDGALHATDFPRDHPLVLVDLGMPRNIDPDVRALPTIRLVDLEELHARAGRPPSPDERDARVEELARGFFERLERLLTEPWIDAFRREAEALRRSEVAMAQRFLGELDADQRIAIERLTHRLVNRILAAPMGRLRSLPHSPEGERQRQIALDLLRPDLADL
jgi:glutamyl-tRNA reductase